MAIGSHDDLADPTNGDLRRKESEPMSLTRVHNFAISLDGFGTGEGLSREAYFGHAGERLHEWMFATRFWHEMVGKPGGSMGVDHAFAVRNETGIGAEIMGRGKFGPPVDYDSNE